MMVMWPAKICSLFFFFPLGSSLVICCVASSDVILWFMDDVSYLDYFHLFFSFFAAQEQKGVAKGGCMH